jgi:hypothetical protein
MMKIQTLISALVLAASGTAFAQVPLVVAPADPTATPRVDKRIANQQKRIDQGVASGQLTAKETNRLDKREAKLAANTAAAKADGTVTKAERVQLNRQASRNSKVIRKQKHDGQTAAPAAAK